MTCKRRLIVIISCLLVSVLSLLLPPSAGTARTALAQEEAAGANKTAPVIKAIEFKTEDGRSKKSIISGEVLTLSVAIENADMGDFAVAWTVRDAKGNDLSAALLDNPNAAAPSLTAREDETGKAGVYLVQATLTAPGGSTAIKKAYIRFDTKDNSAPHNSIAVDTSSGIAPLTVELDCQAFDTDGRIVSYCWDFDGGDAGNCESTERAVSRKFEMPGDYEVTCVVTDDKGGASFDRLTVAARGKDEAVRGGDNHPPSIDSCYAVVYGPAEENTVALIVKASDEDNDNLSIEWSVSAGSLSSSTSPISIWKVPSEPGKYTAEVSVSDGASAPAIHYITTSIADESADKKREPAKEEETPAPSHVLVDVGRLPSSIAINESQNRVFVGNGGSNSISVINAVTNKVVDTFKTDGIPGGIAVNQFDGKVYAANRGGLTVNVFDGLTGSKPMSNIYTGGQNMSHVAVDSRRGAYFVTHSDLASGEVIPLDTGTNAPGAAIETGAGSAGIAVNEMTGSVYVANQRANTVSVINGLSGAVVATIAVCAEPWDIVINENTNRAYVSCKNAGSVNVIDGTTNSVLATILVGMGPMGMGVDAERDLIYVANNLEGTISVVSTAINSAVDKIKVGGDPTDIAVHTTLQKIFVTLENQNKVFIAEDKR